MFWHSVIGGLSVLAHWQTWLALLCYSGALFGWQILLGLIMGRDENAGGRQAAGCLLYVFGGAALQALLLSGIIFYLAPLMMGNASPASLVMLSSMWGLIIKACLLALLATMILTFVPFVGGIIANTPGLDTFIQGVVVFRIISSAAIEPALAASGMKVTGLYPGILASVGYLVIAAIFVYSCMAAFAFAGITLQRNAGGSETSPLFFVGMTLIPLMGLLPVFMYAGHVPLAVGRALGS